MRRHGIALGTLFLLLIMVSWGFASAPLNTQSAQLWQNVETSLTGIRAQISVPMVDLVMDEQGSYISIPGVLPNGSPLPSTTTMIHVPNGLGVMAQITATEYVGTGLYAEELAGTVESVVVGDPIVFKGVRLFPLTLSPTRVADDGEIMIANNLQLEVEFAGEDDRAQGSDEPVAVSSEMARTIRSMVMNIDEINVNEVAPVGRILIVVENNTTFLTRIEPYVQWKRQQGYAVEVGHPTSTTSSSAINTLISNYYNDGHPIPLENVLLIGDHNGSCDMVAYYDTYQYTSYSDYYYALQEGGDLIADVAIGRFSVQDGNTELARVVNKTIAYERDVYMADTFWFTQACMQAGSSTSGFSTVFTNRSIGDMIAAHGVDSDTLWYTMTGADFPQHTVDVINEGACIFNFRGYLGMAGWSNSYLDQMNNASRLPIVTILTCGTGDFATTTTEYSEGFLRAGSGGTTFRGGVAAIGTATIHTNTRCNNIIDAGIYEGLAMRNVRSLGWALNLGKYRLYEAYTGTSESNNVHNFCYWNNLMGDPTLRAWIGIPDQISVTHESAISWGQNYLDVDVVHHGDWPELIWATLADEDEVLSTHRIDASESIRLMFDPSDVETSMTLTVVGDNVVPYQATITVSTAADYVYVQSTVVDDGVGDDNLANPGETVSLDLTMRNGGSTYVGSQTATVTTSSPYLSIVGGNTFNVPALASGSSTTVSDAVTVAVSANTPNGMIPELTVTVGANQISDAHLTVYGFTVSAGSQEVVFGGDGQIDPDETATLAIPWTNLGDITVTGATGTLTTTTSNITIMDGVASYPSVPVNSTGLNSGDPFSVIATADAWPGMPIEFKLVIEDEDNGRDSTTYRTFVSDPAANGITGPDDYGYWALSNIDGGYGVYAQYEWLDIGTAGNNLGISDTSEDGDDGTVVSLPFVFGYYGEIYNLMTVSSNGTISFDSNDLYYFRNWPIPNPLGPPAMLAVNWDDLVTTGGGVYGYYDVANGTYTVQWDTKTRQTSASQVFQAVLYNPAVWPTESGNGVIKFQYQSFSEELSPYYDNDYCTVGIESPNQDDGIQWLYWGDYGTNTSTINSGTAIVFTDDLSGGTGGVDPEAEITPSEINVPYDDQIVIENVHIANVGAEGNLYWSITEEGNVIDGAARRAAIGLPVEPIVEFVAEADIVDQREYQRQKQEEADAASRAIDLGDLKDNGGGNSVDDLGGPDSYGYSWIDSNEPGGPTYSWHSNYGTALPLSFASGNDDDGYFSGRALGFTFEYYGITYSNVYINTNGFLTFQSGQTASGSYSNEALPSTSAPINPPASMLAPFWDDLDLGEGGTVYFYTNNTDLAVITYYNIGGWGGSGQYRFQMLLHGDGSIVFQYDAMGTVDITSATIGMQSDSGTIGLTTVYNSTYVEDDLAIRYAVTTKWFEALDTVGLLLPGESTDARIEFDGDGLPDGVYEGTVIVSTNDQDHPTTNIPVALYVGTQFQPPVVTDIPNQSIDPGQSFTPINLDDYVSDPNYNDNQLSWEATGQVELSVGIVNRVATITPPSPEWTGSETITFTATNPMMGSDSDDATFSVGAGVISVPVAGGCFEMVGFPLILGNYAVDQVFSSVTDLEIVYADDGGVYWPSHAINTIGNISQTEGYRFYTDTAQNFTFTGTEMNPTAMYSATADQWNWVGQPFITPVAVDVAFSPIVANLNIVLNDDGDVYWPDLGVNTIGDMTPGDGYQIYVDANLNWAYSSSVLLAAGPTQQMITELPAAPSAPNPTGMPYLVHVKLHEDMQEIGVEVIEILDGQTVVGSGYLLPERKDAIIVAWKGDTESQIAGFGEGSSLDIRVLDGSGSVIETKLVGEGTVFGQGSHAELVVRSAALPTEFDVGVGYPNPFNPTITVPYALPQSGKVTFAVYNVLGQQVFSQTQRMDAGRHQFLFSPDKGISSGVYFLQVQYGKQMNRQKIMLLK